MTVQLGERQTGFDTNKLGFPSIDACMAIVVVLPEGLYGYHSFGGEVASSWTKIIPKFKDFIEGKGGNLANATRLYGITHLSKRGWRAGARKEVWTEELAAYATGLGLTCRISGYNLDDAVGKFHTSGKSAYVEFEKFGSKCDVSVQTWDSVIHTTLKASQNPWGDDIKTIQGGNLTAVQGDIFDPVTAKALRKISKTKLQG
ncbi:MAG: hypothetical protein KGQ79_06480 [Proteobacteria bacterium]|nr:hypothetical protein [Pseudomonadota bacterium]MBU6424776.1 hypothetical protein [Rhodospirillales bacterium]